MKKTLLAIWQLPQTCVALLILCFYKAAGKVLTERRPGYGRINPVIYALDYKGYWGFSLGTYIFMSYPLSRMSVYVAHECGHSLQSRFLGWFYLPVIALPSLIVTAISPDLADRCFFEKWANRLAEKV
jgi:hypothetical protein